MVKTTKNEIEKKNRQTSITQSNKHAMAGKRWQGGKDGAMMKKRRFGRAVGFIFAPLSLFLLLLLLLSSSFQKETTNFFFPFL